MIIQNGIGLSDGIAIGRICMDVVEEETEFFEIQKTDIEKELLRYEKAKKFAIQQLRELAKNPSIWQQKEFLKDSSVWQSQKAEKEKSRQSLNEAAAVFEAQAVLLEDNGFAQFVCNEIRTNRVNAELAVTRTGDYYVKKFENLGDVYLKERALDMKDVTERVKSILCKKREAERNTKRITEKQREEIEPNVDIEIKIDTKAETDTNTNINEKTSMIYISEELTPGRFMELHQKSMLAFAVQDGSTQSHTAILARSFACPALCGIQIDSSWNGKMAVLDVDGKEGKLLLDPDRDTLEEYRKKQQIGRQQKMLFQEWKGRKSVTKFGRSIELLANINSIKELPAVLENDAEGIGLFRSEFLFLESESFPTEEEQFQVYKKILETMQNKRTVIRTLDLGADKQKNTRFFKANEESLNLKQDSFNAADTILEEQMSEKNPALGCRGIRFSLKNPELFRTQLRALFRASVFGNLAILYPMITSLWEVQKIKEISNAVKAELLAEGVTLGAVEEGIMIETPAAALMSAQLAKEVDFFSIGTNDLTQYTLAMDRQNQSLTEFYDAHHPAVLDLIRMTVEHAHQAGIKAEICGELAADLSLNETFLTFGIDALSVTPQNILPLRKQVCELPI